jgi:hypothetical protein
VKAAQLGNVEDEVVPVDNPEVFGERLGHTGGSIAATSFPANTKARVFAAVANILRQGVAARP